MAAIFLNSLMEYIHTKIICKLSMSLLTFDTFTHFFLKGLQSVGFSVRTLYSAPVEKDCNRAFCETLDCPVISYLSFPLPFITSRGHPERLKNNCKSLCL